jgi:hypothetical protein
VQKAIACGIYLHFLNRPFPPMRRARSRRACQHPQPSHRSSLIHQLHLCTPPAHPNGGLVGVHIGMHLSLQAVSRLSPFSSSSVEVCHTDDPLEIVDGRCSTEQQLSCGTPSCVRACRRMGVMVDMIFSTPSTSVFYTANAGMRN